MLKKYEKKYSDKCYTSVEDIPIYNWWKLHETGDYSYVLKEKHVVEEIVNPILREKWDQIYDTYISRFGFAPELMAIHNQEKKIAKLKAQRMATGNRKLNTDIKVEEHILQEMRKMPQQKADFYEIKAVVEQARGIALDAKVVTAAEFFTYLALLKKTPTRNGRR